MKLKEYRKKRDFQKTKEPKGKATSPAERQLLFVVQKHNARTLHYDFRLELFGVLKSWAVPKGPSMNPQDKRLAMMVEDHPFDYKDFEGIIPKGQYGAGEVIVWDNGNYAPIDGGLSRKENEKLVEKGLKKGDLKIVLNGRKLKGEFAVIKLKKDDNSWLIIKKNDDYSGEKDILKKDKSVISSNTIEILQKRSKDK